jgi:hypothetical protein
MNADPTALTIAMLAVFALAAGGIFSIVKRREKKQGILMLVAGLVLLGNVLIWVWP